ncbi:MAG: TetR/AcrR family transcriptional regulator, partial [Pseudomonadota bacterium]
IASEGYDRLSLRALARASDIKLGALQSHFPNRDALLRALTDYLLSEYLKSLHALEQVEGALSIYDVARWYLSDFAGLELKGDWLWPQLFAMSRVEPSMKELVDDISKRIVHIFEDYFHRAGSPNPRLEALALYSFGEGSTLFTSEGSPWASDAKDLNAAVLSLIEAKYGKKNADKHVA